VNRAAVHNGAQFPVKLLRETVTLIRIMGVHQAHVAWVVRYPQRMTARPQGFPSAISTEQNSGGLGMFGLGMSQIISLSTPS
jgi:hypothetical protein